MKYITPIVSGTAIVTLLMGFAAVAQANHAWGNYHWARSTPSFTLKLGDNMSASWDPYLAYASAQWNPSDVLDTTIVAGSSFNARTCKPTLGMVQVCNYRYGNNGWLGIASIWANGDHVVQGTVKLNDTYFNTSTYNKPAWKQLVVCQEIAHTFGLGHQDETFNNPNLGSCMDYTNDPDGTIYHQLSNVAPNAHDFEELDIIYSHLDTFTTVSQSTALKAPQKAEQKPEKAQDEEDIGESPKDWGKETHRSKDGRASTFEKDLGNGKKAITEVFWAIPQ